MLKPFVSLLFLLFLSADPAAGSDKTHCKVYSDLSMTRIGEWTPTEILVPKGAMVGVIAEGTVSIWKGRERKTFPPAPFLKFRIGEGGPLRGLARFYNSVSVNMVHTQTEGTFYYSIGPQFRDPRNKSAQIKATILVWQKQAKSFAQGALEISARHGYKGLQGEALLMISEALFHLKEREEASRRAEEVLRLAAELRRGSKNLAGRAHMLLGFLSLQEGKLSDALGHAEKAVQNLSESNLRFTRSEEDDGRLTVSEIFDIEVRASLVTLSACETGLARGTGGDFPMGDDLVGLSRAFIHAGAPSVVASLWKVSDDSTVILMHSFYRNLMTMPKAEALRKAQLDLTKSGPSIYAHPYYWAPFILVGDWK